VLYALRSVSILTYHLYTMYYIVLYYQIQITLFFPEIVHNNYMGIYKMNLRITKCFNSDMVEFNRGS